MAINRNSETAEEIRDVFKLQQGIDGIISNVGNQIIPVCDINPKHSRICNIVKHLNNTASGTSTVYTTPTDSDFYLTSAYFSFSKNALCDVSTGTLNMSVLMPDGSSASSLLSHAVITLTAQNGALSISFPTPILLKSKSSKFITSLDLLWIASRSSETFLINTCGSCPPSSINLLISVFLGSNNPFLYNLSLA
jgi:hypothetical protein